MLKKIFCVFALAVMLLTMVPMGASAETCDHDYTHIGQNSCCDIFKCKHCGELSYSLLPSAFHAYPEDTPCEEYPVCTRCGQPDIYIQSHSYKTSLFGGFTYCTNCHEYTFSFWSVDWITLFAFLGGLAFFIFIIILIPKARRSD